MKMIITRAWKLEHSLITFSFRALDFRFSHVGMCNCRWRMQAGGGRIWQTFQFSSPLFSGDIQDSRQWQRRRHFHHFVIEKRMTTLKLQRPLTMDAFDASQWPHLAAMLMTLAHNVATCHWAQIVPIFTHSMYWSLLKKKKVSHKNIECRIQQPFNLHSTF